MAASKSLPARPSLESLRKQAKKLARDAAAGDAGAIARIRVHLPHLPQVELSLTQRNAQLVIAREYGFDGWRDLIAEVSRRLDRGLEWAVAEARRIIHDNDVEALKRLLAEYPALLSWKEERDRDSDGDGGVGGVLGFATGSYGDSSDPVSEEHFTRAACAERLIDAGAIVMPSVCEGLLRSHAKGLLQLFQRKGLLPRTIKFVAAFGDVDAMRAALDESENGSDLAAVTDAFTIACGFKHEAVASLLLDRAVALDPELGAHVDGGLGRPAFVKYYIDNRPSPATEVGLWKAFVMEQVSRAVNSWSGHSTSVAHPTGESDLTAFVRLLQREPWLLGEPFVDFQAGIIGRAILKNRGEFITALYDLDPAAVSYTHLTLPTILRV